MFSCVWWRSLKISINVESNLKKNINNSISFSMHLMLKYKLFTTYWNREFSFTITLLYLLKITWILKNWKMNFFLLRKYLRVVPGMCLEKVWVIPISGKCCRKILSEKWKINPFFQFCSWHFQPSNRAKRLVSWPSSPLLTSNWARLKAGKYLVWFGAPAGR